MNSAWHSKAYTVARCSMGSSMHEGCTRGVFLHLKYEPVKETSRPAFDHEKSFHEVTRTLPEEGELLLFGDRVSGNSGWAPSHLQTLLPT